MRSCSTKAGSAASSSTVYLLGCTNPPAKLSGAQGCSSDLQSVPLLPAHMGTRLHAGIACARWGTGRVWREWYSHRKKSEVSAFSPKQRIVLCPLYLSCSAFSYALKQLQADQANQEVILKLFPNTEVKQHHL